MPDGMVSVILNAHNSAHLIERPLRSVLAQTFKNWELIVWDNASIDDLPSVLDKHVDPRIRFVADSKPRSLYESRVMAIRQARGEFVAFIDHDDCWLPNKLEIQLPLFADPTVVVTCSDYWTCRSREGMSTSRSLSRTYEADRVSLDSVLLDYRVALPTVMARRSTMIANFPQVPPDFFIVEDMDLVCRTLRAGCLGVLHKATAEYWVHDTNLSRNRHMVIAELEQWLESWIAERGETDPLPKWVKRRRYDLAVLRSRRLLAEGDRWKGVSELPRDMALGKRLKYLGAAALFSRARLRSVFSAR